MKHINKHLARALCLLLLSLPATLFADTPRVGLVLSGGGARGLAHIGVLKVLEANDIQVDYIAGTSMGAIIGGLYAAGYSARQIEDIVGDIEWTTELSDSAPRRYRSMRQKDLERDLVLDNRIGVSKSGVSLPLGVLQGQQLQGLFTTVLLPVREVTEFDQLQIPFRAVATDLETGDEVVLTRGNLADALRASMAVPAVFAPAEIDGRILVDGGLANNMPVDVVRAMGAEQVIAVDVSMPLLKREQLDSVLGVTEQITTLMVARNTSRQKQLLQENDLLVVPDLEGITSASFTAQAAAVTAGETAARAALAGFQGQIAKRATPRGRMPDHSAPVVEFIELENQSWVNDEILLSRLDLPLGVPLDEARLDASIEEINGLEYFSLVKWVPVVREDGSEGIRVTAYPVSWGTSYVQAGLSLNGDFSGGEGYTLGAAWSWTGINQIGGELRAELALGEPNGLAVDFYQPLDPAARWYVNPQVFLSQREVDVFSDEQRIGVVGLSSAGIDIGLGRNFGTTGLLELSYRRAAGDVDELTGSLPLTKEEYDVGELLLSSRYDSLDSLAFPRSGWLVEGQVLAGSRSLGADSDFQQIQARFVNPFTIGRHTFLVQARGGYSLDDDAPLERMYELGGFNNLSGSSPSQFLGQHYAFASLAWYRRLGNTQYLPSFAGLTLETGNTFNSEDEIRADNLRYGGSLFIGTETPVGPVYAAWGYLDGGESTFYLFLGNPLIRGLPRL